MQPITASFIIVNYRMPELVCRCVHSIEKHTQNHSYEIIVVDNASGDDSAARFERMVNVVLIRNSHNVGFGAANNQAAKLALGKYLFFLNPDAYLLSDAVNLLSDFMENPSNQSVACCGADLVDEHGNKQMSHGNFPSLLEVFSQMGFYRFYRRFYEKQLTISLRTESIKPEPVDYVLGAAMFVRAEIFKAVGGFDAQFFLYFEETELAYRFKKAGYRSVLIPQVKIVHLEGGFDKDGAYNYAKIKWFSESRQLYFKKVAGRGTAFLVKVILLIQALVRCIYHWDTHHYKVFRIIAKS